MTVSECDCLLLANVSESSPMIKNSTVSLLLPLVVVHVDVVVIALAIGCSCVFYCCCDWLLLLLFSLSVAMENVRSLGEVWWSADSR